MNDKRNCKTPLRSVLLKAGSFEVYFHSKSSFTEVQAMRIIVTSKSLRFPLKIMFQRRRKLFHRVIQRMRERMCEEPCVFLVQGLVWLDGISRYTCIIITRWMLIILHYILIIYNIYYISTLYIIYCIYHNYDDQMNTGLLSGRKTLQQVQCNYNCIWNHCNDFFNNVFVLFLWPSFK